MNAQRLHFLASSICLLILIVFGRALFLLVTETSLAGVAKNLALVFGGTSLVGLLVSYLLLLIGKASKPDVLSALKNSWTLASVILLWYYGYAVWFWNWPYNDQKGQPLYYENFWHWVGFPILALSVALWIFWNRKLRTVERMQQQGE